jgi:hypothetical protein
MKIAFVILALFLILIFPSCVKKHSKSSGLHKVSIHNQSKSYGYHPLDPLPVDIKFQTQGSITPENKSNRILNSLPDETMRLAIGEITRDGGISFGSAKAGFKGKSYIVILDYMKFTTLSLPVQRFNKFDVLILDAFMGKSDNKVKTNSPDNHSHGETNKDSNSTFIVPVYIGVGVRLTANITVNEGKIDLGNLFALGAAANTQKISGTLTIQTLGISGESISTIIPMPSEINPTTIQNAILAIGTIKAKIYDSKTTINPRVVGVYNTLEGGPETINEFITQLLKQKQIINIE